MPTRPRRCPWNHHGRGSHNRAKSYCPKGHPYSGANLRVANLKAAEAARADLRAIGEDV